MALAESIVDREVLVVDLLGPGWRSLKGQDEDYCRPAQATVVKSLLGWGLGESHYVPERSFLGAFPEAGLFNWPVYHNPVDRDFNRPFNSAASVRQFQVKINGHF